MQVEQKFTVSPEQLMKLACAQLQSVKSLPDGMWEANLTIETDGRAARVTEAVLSFREAAAAESE